MGKWVVARESLEVSASIVEFLSVSSFELEKGAFLTISNKEKTGTKQGPNKDLTGIFSLFYT